MKIAVISDIHGNLEALKETIKDIEKRKVDKIICLGDIVGKGAHPNECVEIIKKHCDVVIKGNCDRHFTSEHNIQTMNEIERTRIEWNQKVLTNETKEYLSKLPYCYETYISGSFVRLFHAAPDRDNKAVVNQDSIKTKYEMFLPSEKTISQKEADVVIYGHIHHQYMDVLYNKTLINVGSVGDAFNTIRNPQKDSNTQETTRANYLIIEGEEGNTQYGGEISFNFIKVCYDVDKELENKNNIEVEDYKHELKNGMYRNMTKINEHFKEVGVNIDEI